MNIATRLGLATRGLRGGLGETIIIEVPVETPYNYYIYETVEFNQPTTGATLIETIPVITVQEIGVEVSTIIEAEASVSSMEIRGVS